ncbi:MAG: hypothetical protein JWQ27_2952 [Ferruginibacter sp.]|nr:hypothetical protein [Ferruginibacter sp.]
MKVIHYSILSICFLFLLTTCLFQVALPAQSKEEATEQTSGKKKGTILFGQASFYANKFHGRQTASGETFSQEKYTAACNSLPLGTWIQVTNLKNGKIVVVKTNDRLHPKTRRLVDLTKAAAQKLGFVSMGLTRVKVEVLDQKKYK